MRVLPILNNVKYNNVSNLPKYSQNRILSNKAQDSFSFTGKQIVLQGNMEEINSQEFPQELYLNMDKVYKTLENTRGSRRFQSLQFILADTLAKRCNYLGITKNAKNGLVGFDNKEAVITVAEQGKKKNPKAVDFNWSEQYEELEEFFEGTEDYEGASNDMTEIKMFLPEYLKKYGWIQRY